MFDSDEAKAVVRLNGDGTMTRVERVPPPASISPPSRRPIADGSAPARTRSAGCARSWRPAWILFGMGIFNWDNFKYC